MIKILIIYSISRRIDYFFFKQPLMWVNIQILVQKLNFDIIYEQFNYWINIKLS